MSRNERLIADLREELGLRPEETGLALREEAHASFLGRLPGGMTLDRFVTQLAALASAERVAQSVTALARTPVDAHPKPDPESEKVLTAELPRDEHVRDGVRIVLERYLSAVTKSPYKNKDLGIYVNRSGSTKRVKSAAKSSPLKLVEATDRQGEIENLITLGMTELEARARVLKYLEDELLAIRTMLSQHTPQRRLWRDIHDELIAKQWCYALHKGALELISVLKPLCVAQASGALTPDQAALRDAFEKAARAYYSSQSLHLPALAAPELEPYRHVLYKLMPRMRQEIARAVQVSNGKSRAARRRS